jgi:hypothetical protein
MHDMKMRTLMSTNFTDTIPAVIDKRFTTVKDGLSDAGPQKLSTFHSARKVVQTLVRWLYTDKNGFWWSSCRKR